MRRRSEGERAEALVDQVVSRLIDYPDTALIASLPSLTSAIAVLPAKHAALLEPLLDRLGSCDLVAVQADYVETFDLRRRCSLYLSYYAYGDTRKRGMALLAFKTAYRAAGVELDEGELPDHLAVVLEFTGSVDLAAGRRLLIAHRAGLEVLRLSLRDAESPYEGAMAAVSATLPALRGDDMVAVRRLIAEGPPAEEVGLDPFGPPSAAPFFDLASLRVRS